MTDEERAMHEVGLKFQQRCRERRPDPEIEKAAEALVRLVEVAQGHSGQCHHIRRFLLGIYNPEVWPFELNRLKCLDGSLQHDCLRVLEFNTLKARQELHTYLVDGDDLFKRLWEREKGEDEQQG